MTDKPVVVYGASGYTGRLICEYLREYNLPFTAVIMNNGAWGNIRHEQARQFSQTNATQLSVANYEKVAEAFGGYGERGDDAAGVGPAIRRAIDSGKPAVVNVITQPGVVRGQQLKLFDVTVEFLRGATETRTAQQRQLCLQLFDMQGLSVNLGIAGCDLCD